MPFHFTCPHCNETTYVDDEHLGRSGPCGQCGKPITITRSDNPQGNVGGRTVLWVAGGMLMIGVLLVMGVVGLGLFASWTVQRQAQQIELEMERAQQAQIQMAIDAQNASAAEEVEEETAP